MTTTRNDIHRQSEIIPSNYHYVLSYSLPTSNLGWPIPSYGVNCELDMKQTKENGKVHYTAGEHTHKNCCVVGLRNTPDRFAEYGGTGKCTICGASFIYGEVWQHKTTREYIHVGNTCAARMGLASNDKVFQTKRLAFVREAVKREKFDTFCAEHPGLEDALNQNHHILKDMSNRLRQFGSLSDKQIALAMKIAEDIKNPQPIEINIPAPEGKHRWEGTIVKVKQSEWGPKLILKTVTDDGVWLAMGSIPKGLEDCNKGDCIRLTATLKRGKDDHFAFYSRPSKGELINQ